MSEIEEIKNYWHFNGESNEINDIVSLREIAITDIHKLAYEVKRLEQNEKSFEDYTKTLNEARRKRDEVKGKLEVALKELSEVKKEYKQLAKEIEMAFDNWGLGNFDVERYHIEIQLIVHRIVAQRAVKNHSTTKEEDRK